MAASGLFEGYVAYGEALRETLLQACASGCREQFWIDAGFVDWPLSEPALLEALSSWARLPGRRLHLLALDYEDLRRRHPRFVQWRAAFGHCVEARAYEPQSGGAGLAAALFTGGGALLSLRLFDAQQWRGSVSREASDGLRTREWFDALAQRSSESFAATTLGL
ncbi:hypothetical protein [Roseateles violae]|uniref:Uncharacterized protein n=1 Tax=Roseateles violae TaxID=3058042 RepID=A0ABT8DUY6_9BURK|nr:hypothetical protein [Pelomonas sp. PFR6]MDN3921891.1 hypothetical protein [Pelomonas sp. PFR6]